MNIEKFKAIIKRRFDYWKEYDESEGTSATFCNFFVRDCVADLIGTNTLQGMMANDIYNHLAKYGTKVSINPEPSFLAIGDKIYWVIIAAQRGKVHGHVNIILPGRPVFSTKWNAEVPICANIGATNRWEIGLNYCFAEKPDLFAIDLPTTDLQEGV